MSEDTIRVSRSQLDGYLEGWDVPPDARKWMFDALVVAEPEAHDVCENSRDCLTCKQRIAPNFAFCFNCHADALQKKPRRFTEAERRALKNAQALYPVTYLGWPEDWAVLQDMRIEAEREST